MNSLAERASDYFETLARIIRETAVTGAGGQEMTLDAGIGDFLVRGHRAHAAGNRLLFAGNGASAAMAAHYALDFSRHGGIRALALNDAVVLTALANDIGPEALFAEQIRAQALAGDVFVAISSSGASPNILAAIARARAEGCEIITFSGFDPANPLRGGGDLNFHVAGDEYGLVETAHAALLHAILDLSLGRGTGDDRNPGALKRRRQAAG